MTEKESSAAAPKSPWNTLEAAKLIMSSATPIAIAVIGWNLSQQATIEAGKRAEAAALTDATARTIAARQAERLRLSDEKRAADLRKADQAREDALRREAIARDDFIRYENLTREAANKSRDLDFARYNKLLQERFSTWGITSPSLGIINARFKKGKERTGDVNSLGLDGSTIDLLDRCDSAFEAAMPYMSPEFMMTYKAFSIRVRLALNRSTVTDMDRKNIEDAYLKLMFAASDELGLTSRRTAPLAFDVDKLRR